MHEDVIGLQTLDLDKNLNVFEGVARLPRSERQPNNFFAITIRWI